MTYYCPECVVNWWPYQAKDGCCPECGKGTTRKPMEAGSIDADARYKVARKAGRERDASVKAHEDFEAYYLATRGRVA
jgi:hypothetical protein